MAKANIKKTEKQDQNYHSMKAYNLKRSLSTKILPFAGLHFIEFSETVSYEINFVSQSLYLEVLYY